MNETDELHPIEAVALVALAVGWAALTMARAVTVPLVALALTLAGWRPAAPLEARRSSTEERPPVPPEAPPLAAVAHPCGALALELERLPVTRLRELAGVRSKRHRKVELIAMVTACV